MNDFSSNFTADEIKSILLPMMDSIDRFCRTNSIDYYMLGGTMLGAIRHKGFIPWDDDIDIGMLRSDYERFCENYKDIKNPNYKLICLKNNKRYYLPFAKVINTDTILFEDIYHPTQLGVYIDVFPLDYVDKENIGYKQFFANSKVRVIEQLRYMSIKKNHTVFDKIRILLSRIMCPLSLHQIARCQERRAQRASCSKQTKWVANLFGAWGEKEVVDSAWFNAPSEYFFEGRKLFGPKEYDKYLTSLYGNYLELPPVEKQISHHMFVASWK